MKTLMDQEKNRLLKRFHTLLGKNGDAATTKEAILDSFGVTSSRDLNAHELLEACNYLSNALDTKAAETDRWRKRLIAAISAWLRAMNIEHDLDAIKRIACRAAGKEHQSFNAIPTDRIRSLYYAFSNKAKDLKTVQRLTTEELDYLSWNN